MDGYSSSVLLVSMALLVDEFGNSGAGVEGAEEVNSSSSLLMLFSEVASRGISGDFDDGYSTTSMLGEGRISLILTSVMTGISETGVISLIVISGLADGGGGGGAAVVPTSSITTLFGIMVAAVLTPENRTNISCSEMIENINNSLWQQYYLLRVKKRCMGSIKGPKGWSNFRG